MRALGLKFHLDFTLITAVICKVKANGNPVSPWATTPDWIYSYYTIVCNQIKVATIAKGPKGQNLEHRGQPLKSSAAPLPGRLMPWSISSAVMVRGGMKRTALGLTPFSSIPASLAWVNTCPEMSLSNSIATSSPLPRTSEMKENRDFSSRRRASRALPHQPGVVRDVVFNEVLGPGVGGGGGQGVTPGRWSRGRRAPGPCRTL